MASVALTCVAPSQAASSRDKTTSSQAAKSKAKAKAKVAEARASKKSPRLSRAEARKNTATAKSRTRVAEQRQARKSGIIRAVASSDDDLPARVVPVSVQARPIGRGGRVVIASPSVSSSSGASFGQIYGLHQTVDPLALKSSVALVMDQETNEVLLAKNSDAVLPIASLTKLMTALVVVESRLPMDEELTISADDVDTEKNSSSRLMVGTRLTRGDALHLALMSSENRAAHALGRYYPGGLPAFVNAMNAKARMLGMRDTHYVEPTGLSSQNQSSAKDLASLVKSAYQQHLIRELSTSPEYAVQVGARQLQFRTTNALVRNPTWDIGLQKTGYIVEAGRCLVLQASMAGRKLIMVFLDSTGKYSRQADAERVRRWIEAAPRQSVPAAAELVHKATS
ncbi:MAG: D-alanyl-D-alanine endopeptidase [Rubrivivax sp.]|nr:MAG: D-alanyl-D-alanine endopeptidase [Rubrivivax sp.]